MLTPLLLITIFIFIGVLPGLASQEEGDDPGLIQQGTQWAKDKITGAAGAIVEGVQDLLQGEDTGFTQETADEIRFQKQCFLAYNMLELHQKVLEHESQRPEEPVTKPKNHTVLRGAPAADITSLVVSRPEIQPLMEVRPQLLSYLVPYIRLYKVYGSPRPDLEMPDAPPNNTEVEFIFDTHLSREDIDMITSTRSGRPGGVGLESFSWEFLGRNPAEVENNIRATLNVHFNNMKDFERERRSLGTGHPYRFSDLVIPEPLYQASSASEIAAQRSVFNAKFFRLKVVAGWATPRPQGAERETFEQLLDGISYDEFQEMVRLNKKVMYMNLIRHNISFNQDGSMSLSAEYQAVVEGTLTSQNSDILKVRTGPGTMEAEATIEQIGDDMRALNDAQRCRDRSASETGDPGAPLTVELPEGGRGTVHYSPDGVGDDDEEEDLRDLEEDMARHQREAEQVRAMYARCDRAQAYSNLMRRLMSGNRVYRVLVEPQALGFDSFPMGEGIERQHVQSLLRQGQAAYTSLGGTGYQGRAEPGLGERVESMEASMSWIGAALGLGGDSPSNQRQDARARQEMEVDPALLRRMMAINRFYSGTNFTVERLGSRQAAEVAQCGDLMGVIAAMGDLGGLNLGSLGTSEFEEQMAENEEQLTNSITRMRNWVLYGDPETTTREEGGILDSDTIRPSLIPVDFMFFGDILDAVMDSDMDWIEENHVEMYLGSFTYNDPREHIAGQSGTTPGTSIPLAWIPISFELFSMWFLEEIVEKQREQMSLRGFIRSVFDKLVSNAFGGECVYDPSGRFFLTQESISGIPEFYTIPKYKIVHNNLGPRGTVTYNHMYNVLRNPENPVHLMDYEEDGTFDTYVNIVLYQGRKSDEATNLVHQRDMNERPYLDIAAQDIEEGIYHLNLGSDRGLVKTINFNRMDQAYDRVYRMEQAGELGNSGGVATIRERYNASVSMYGNMFFYPGQHVFINPSMVGAGTVPEMEALLNKLGIGGYFFVKKVENIIERGLFETNLDCVWVHSGFVTDGVQQQETQCGTNITLSRAYPTTEPVDRIGEAFSAVDEAIDDAIDWVGEKVSRAQAAIGLGGDEEAG